MRTRIIIYIFKWLFENRYSLFFNNKLALGCLEDYESIVIINKGDFKVINFKTKGGVKNG